MEKQHFTAINQVMNPWFRTFVAGKQFVQEQINSATVREAFNGLGSLFSNEKPEPKYERWTVSDWIHDDDVRTELEHFLISLKYPRSVCYAHAIHFDEHNVRRGRYKHPILDVDIPYSSSRCWKYMARLILGYAIDDCDWPRDVFERDISSFGYFDKHGIHDEEDIAEGFEGLGSLFG